MLPSGTSTLGRGAGGAGGARISLRTELFPSLLSFEGALSCAVDSFVQKHFSGTSSQTPKLAWYYSETKC